MNADRGLFTRGSIHVACQSSHARRTFQARKGSDRLTFQSDRSPSCIYLFRTIRPAQLLPPPARNMNAGRGLFTRMHPCRRPKLPLQAHIPGHERAPTASHSKTIGAHPVVFICSGDQACSAASSSGLQYERRPGPFHAEASLSQAKAPTPGAHSRV